MSKQIEVFKQESPAIVDDNVFESIRDNKYYKSTAGYAVRRVKKGQRWRLILLQREVLDFNKVDKKAVFKDGNKFNCTLENLLEVKEETDGIQG